MRACMFILAILVTAVPGCIWEDRCVSGAVREGDRCVLPTDAGPIDGSADGSRDADSGDVPEDGSMVDTGSGDSGPRPSCTMPSDCPDASNSARDCVDSECVYACSSGWANCNDDLSDGCEVDTTSNRTHCAACHNECGPSGACLDSTCVDPVAEVTAGELHTCIRTLSGDLYCWGANPDGQLGDGTLDTHSTPTLAPGISDAISVSVAGRSSCAVRSGGTVECWGQGRTSPTPVTLSGDATSVASGGAHACAIVGTSIWCWGAGSSGQLGDGTATSSASPVEVDAFAGDPMALSLGNGHSCSTASTGRIYCWGTNFAGQLGFGTTGGQRAAPVAVRGLTDAFAVGTGNGHSCALRGSGIPYCWGNNSYGQLGTGTTDPADEPAAVLGDVTDATMICGGEAHNCLVRSSGEVLCWGYNATGQLGDGSLEERHSPVVVSLPTAARFVACGHSHSCAITDDEKVWCWGENVMGRLGDGTSMTRSTPVEVVGLPPPE